MLDEPAVKAQLLQANREGRAFVFPAGRLLAATFAGALLDGARIESVKLAASDFRFASVVAAELTSVDLSSCRAQEVGLTKTVFRQVDLSRGYFSRAVMNQTRFEQSHPQILGDRSDLPVLRERPTVEVGIGNGFDPGEPIGRIACGSAARDGGLQGNHPSTSKGGRSSSRNESRIPLRKALRRNSTEET